MISPIGENFDLKREGFQIFACLYPGTCRNIQRHLGEYKDMQGIQGNTLGYGGIQKNKGEYRIQMNVFIREMGRQLDLTKCHLGKRR